MRKTKQISVGLLALAAFLAAMSYLQMKYYYLSFLPLGHSDLVGFYVTRFADNIAHWPYSSYKLANSGNTVGPIEYPVLTGLIVWLTALVTPKDGLPRFNYFFLNSALLGALFVAAVYVVMRSVEKGLSKLLILSPAVILSLYLNWDLWAVIPMLISIQSFEHSKYRRSAILLGIAISAKFFPIVLLFPISIIFLKSRREKELFKYILVTSMTWLLINLPVIVFNREGWLYFYKFSATRMLGDGSIFNMFAKFGIVESLPMWVYYVLNVAAFFLLGRYLWKSKLPIGLNSSAFLAVIAFTYFGKQYSMQYVLWLTPLAVLAISEVSKKDRNLVIKVFALWQSGEFLLHYAYFKNMLHEMNDLAYATLASLRYVVTAIFVFVLIKNTKRFRIDKSIMN